MAGIALTTGVNGNHLLSLKIYTGCFLLAIDASRPIDFPKSVDAGNNLFIGLRQGCVMALSALDNLIGIRRAIMALIALTIARSEAHESRG